MRLNIFGGLRPFRPREAGRDALAGVTLASMNIPQVLGYTRIAGTPVVTGLYTVLLPLVAFAVFGSSRHLVVAADSATAAIFSSSLSHMAKPANEKYMALVGMVALLTAGFLLLARFFKLGFLAETDGQAPRRRPVGHLIPSRHLPAILDNVPPGRVLSFTVPRHRCPARRRAAHKPWQPLP
jgi:hypothetical protein